MNLCLKNIHFNNDSDCRLVAVRNTDCNCVCVPAHMPPCHMWPLETCAAILFLVLSLTPTHFLLFPYLSWGPAISDSSPFSSNIQPKGGGWQSSCHPARVEPEWSSHRTIPEISLNLYLRFHLPRGDGGIEGGIYAFGWGEGEEKPRKTALVRISDFPCWTGGGAGRV